MDDFDKWELEETVNRHYLYCVPSVCKKCSELIDKSDKTEDKFFCPYIMIEFHSIDNFQDMYVPEECKNRLEHVVLGKQTGFKKTVQDFLEERDEDLILKMEKENFGKDWSGS